MITVTREHSIASAHRLYEYDGRCERLHGHNYRILVTLASDCLNMQGMVVDFADIKRVLFGELDRQWDHRTLLFDRDPLSRNLAAVEDDGSVVTLPFNPTAENMAAYLATELFPEAMRSAGMQGLRIESVTVYETDKSFAVWKAD